MTAAETYAAMVADARALSLEPRPYARGSAQDAGRLARTHHLIHGAEAIAAGAYLDAADARGRMPAHLPGLPARAALHYALSHERVRRLELLELERELARPPIPHEATEG
jgi:hypothetical protein